MGLAIPLITGLFNLVLGITALVLFFRRPSLEPSDTRCGLIFLIFLALSEVLAFCLNYSELATGASELATLILVDAITLLKWFVAAAVGAKLMRLHGMEWSVFARNPAFRWPACRAALLFSLVLIAYSIGLFYLLKPTAGSMFAEAMAEELEDGMTFLDYLKANVFFVQVAVGEELIYRFCFTMVIFHSLPEMKHRFSVAAILPLLMWTFAHYFSLEESWIKFAQVLPLGLACLYLLRRYGLEAAVLAHVSFNIVMSVVAPPLINLPVGY